MKLANLVLVLITCELNILPAVASLWDGDYSDHSGRKDANSLIRELTIKDLSDNKCHIHIVIHRFLADGPAQNPIVLDGIGCGYADLNNKGVNDSVIATFPKVKHSPLVLIQEGSPYAQRLNEHSRATHLKYQYFENSPTASCVSGDVYRDDFSTKAVNLKPPASNKSKQPQNRR
ncbi:MAG TPA: hypothetical protein V6C86_21345 [Oculatellaceae cyanobacterium]